MKYFFFIIAFLLLPISIMAQQYSVESKKAIKLYEDALNFYDFYQTDQATFRLIDAVEIEPDFIEAYLVLSDIYKQNNNKVKEIETYNRIIEIDPDFFIYTYYNLANALFSTGEYLLAIENLDKFLEYPQINADLKNKAYWLFENCIFADSLVKNPVNFELINLGDEINTEFDDYWPSITADDSTFITTVMIPTEIEGRIYPQEDFYISFKKDGKWTKIEPLGIPINTLGNEGAQSLYVDGKRYFYTACNRRNGLGMCDLYYVEKENGKWNEPEIMRFPLNTRYSEKQPSISPDGKKLYFSSNRPGGKGKMDLWVSEIDTNGLWQEPTNLGDSINTAGDEISPFIHFDNKTLYFSSDAKLGLGGQDIFISRFKDGHWTKPKNLGYPINTYEDEFGLIVAANGKDAYYATKRSEERGRDIFMFELYKEIMPEHVNYVKGLVYDKKTNEKLDAAIELYNINESEFRKKFFSDNEGEFLITLPSRNQYGFSVEKEGYLFFSEHFNLAENIDSTKPYYLNIPLQKIAIGSTSILKNVFFDVDSYELLETSVFELDKLLHLLEKTPTMEIEIGGHTDNSGTTEHNIELSKNRARAVYNYLIEHNVSSNRLSYIGYGENKPVASNNSVKGKAKNRRTEFKVISF
jgi:outer membrane protein OmpA-like peptidoglycan-associated protein